MGETTGIAWTDHTFNPWWGCTKVSPGCDNCYAETFDKRTGGAHWGKGAERRVFGDKHWNEPLKWNVAAAKAGKRARVFCASMADVFDAEAPAGQLERLWAVIRATPNLDWQLLTKRPARIARSLPADWGNGYPNVWLGTTVENQEQAKIRVPVLIEIPAVVRFLSCEPLLERIHPDLRGIDWVIVGGESGPRARPCAIEWIESLMRQCRAAGVPCFVKQMGAVVVSEHRTAPASMMAHPDQLKPEHYAPNGEVWAWRAGLNDQKGADPEQFLELRTREFPEVRHA